MRMNIRQNIKINEKEPLTASFYRRKNGQPKNFRSIVGPVVLSLVFHLVFFILLMFIPKPSLEKSYDPTVIDVHMVSPGELQGEMENARDPVPETKSKPSAAPEISTSEPEISTSEPEIEVSENKPEAKKSPPEQSTTQPEAEISLSPDKKPEKKVKESLKKRTFQPSTVVRNTIERLEKKTETQKETHRPGTVTDAIERLRKNLNKGHPEGGDTKKTSLPENNTASKESPGGNGTADGKGLKSWKPFAIYNVEIAYQIQKNWAFSEQLSGEKKNLETLVGIKILPNGDIKDIWIDKRSGNSYLDESVIRAIKKSSPLPPLPKDFTGPFYTVGLRFTPKGITR